MTKNPYELWWRCLQLVPLKEWKPAFRRHVGSARDLPFEDWWAEVRQFFEEVPPVLTTVMEDMEQIEGWGLWQHKELNEAVFVVNLDNPTKVLMDDIEQKLKELQRNKRGRPVRPRFAEYPLAGTPNVEYINKLLNVFHAREVEGKKLWEAAIDAELVAFPHPGDADGRNVLGASAGRAIKQAKALIFRASQGDFPSY